MKIVTAKIYYNKKKSLHRLNEKGKSRYGLGIVIDAHQSCAESGKTMKKKIIENCIKN